MANLAPSAVTVNDWYYANARTGSKRKVVDATLVLTGQGGVTNQILASLFGLRTIDEVWCFVDTTNIAYLATPDTTKLFIIVMQRAAQVLTNGTFKYYVATGVNGAGDITTTGVVAGDVIEAVVDLTTPGKKTASQYTPGTDKVTQAVGAGDTSAKSLLINLRTAATVTAPAAAATDLTATVRCIVVGKE